MLASGEGIQDKKLKTFLLTMVTGQVAVFLLVSVSSGVWGLGERLTRGEREAVTRYLLSRMLGASSSQAREQGDHHGASSIVYPQVRWSLHLNNHIKTHCPISDIQSTAVQTSAEAPGPCKRKL